MKAECRRTATFELWCWRRLLRIPCTARRSNQSILQEISPEYSLEGLIWSWSCNTLATWCEELTHWKRHWHWERMKAGGEGDDGGRDGWMASLTRWTWVWANSRRWWRTGKPGVLQSMELHSQTWPSDWTKLKWLVESQLPEQGLNPGPWQWKHWILTTRPPGNSQILECFNYP